MGCISCREHITFSPFSSQAPQSQLDKSHAIKANIIKAIKRRDSILFEKTMQVYEIRPLEIIGPSTQKKTLLHYAADYNFSEGMSLVIEYISQLTSEEAANILNCKDAKGNTPMIACCLANSYEALEVLMKNSHHLDQNIQNLEGKTALEIVIENASPCLSLLRAGLPTTKRSTRKGSSPFSGRSNHVLDIAKSLQTLAAGKDWKDEDRRTSIGSDTGSRRGSLVLKSVTHLTRDKSDIKPTTKLLRIISTLEEGTNFKDEEFPHDMGSIMSSDDTLTVPKVVKWKRPVEFLHGDFDFDSIKIFENIELNDVSGGLNGWCDLYSALAAMTEYPQRLLKVFTAKEANDHGVYSVNFLVSGTHLEILLDDYFPCNKKSELLFSMPENFELWFLLLEKAFAKLYGSYAQIRNVSVSEALETMTGMPSCQYPLRDAKEDDLWNTLLEYDQRNQIVCAGSDKHFTDMNRIFTVSSVYEVEEKRIVKLRNHYEAVEWDGQLANGSKDWTTELKEEVGHYDGETDHFYMNIQEFMQTFDFFSVCHYNDGWKRNSMQVEADAGEAVFFEFTIEKEMEVFISVHQRLPIFLDKDSRFEISPVEIILAEETIDDGLKGIAFGEKDGLLGKPTVYASDKTKLKLSEGRYVLRIKVRWTDEKSHGFTLNIFAPDLILAQRVEKEDHPNFLELIFLDAAKYNPDNFQLQNRCKFGNGWCGPYFWIYVANNGKKAWNLELLFEKMTNLKLCNSYRKADDEIEFLVLPDKKQVAYARRLNGDPIEMSWKFQQSWEDL